MLEKIIVFVIIILFYYIRKRAADEIKKKLEDEILIKKIIESKTDQWIDAVTIHNDPEKIKKLFCDDATLLGTVSRVNRKGEKIKEYFKYFANLPNIHVTKKKYDIIRISDGTYLNNATVSWSWDNVLKILAPTTVTARMSFLFRNGCIVLLHSSELPKLNEDLYNVSGNY